MLVYVFNSNKSCVGMSCIRRESAPPFTAEHSVNCKFFNVREDPFVRVAEMAPPAPFGEEQFVNVMEERRKSEEDVEEGESWNTAPSPLPRTMFEKVVVPVLRTEHLLPSETKAVLVVV